MDPNDFIKQVASNGQVALYASELARRKAVDFLVANAEISDSKGKQGRVPGLTPKANTHQNQCHPWLSFTR